MAALFTLKHKCQPFVLWLCFLEWVCVCECVCVWLDNHSDDRQYPGCVLPIAKKGKKSSADHHCDYPGAHTYIHTHTHTGTRYTHNCTHTKSECHAAPARSFKYFSNPHFPKMPQSIFQWTSYKDWTILWLLWEHERLIYIHLQENIHFTV